MAEPNFEKDLERLETLVEALEEGGLPLDESLKRFEEGIKLAQRCEKTLASAEKKIEKLTKNAQGEYETEPFADQDTSERADADSGSSAPAEQELPLTVEDEGYDEELLF